jgi:peptidyl-prolyl cis-trans isomerase A (cyclophilin A)
MRGPHLPRGTGLTGRLDDGRGDLLGGSAYNFSFPAADARSSCRLSRADASRETPGMRLGRRFCVEAGTYAQFDTTEGSFTVRLFDKEAPATVANFVGLAEGTKEWRDPSSGEKKTAPYYDGVIFHRIISGFMIQGGDRLGTGTGGPGYSFKDEFHPSRRHSGAGILSMANAGPNTNGSQFFITLGPTPHLDNRHTVFGEVVEGLDVITKIGAVPTGRQDRPVKPVVMNKVTIKRV